MRTSAAVALLLATDTARAVHTRAQKSARLLASKGRGKNDFRQALLQMEDTPCEQDGSCTADHLLQVGQEEEMMSSGPVVSWIEEE